jgi:hypothetical protein
MLAMLRKDDGKIPDDEGENYDDDRNPKITAPPHTTPSAIKAAGTTYAYS